MNQSAFVAWLMRRTADEHRRQERRRRAIDRLLTIRRMVKPRTAAAIRAARVRGRP